MSYPDYEDSHDERKAMARSVFEHPKWQLGDRVMKPRGAAWSGKVVGYYSTSFTPRGYAVESELHPGSVQIYPEAALEGLP